VWSRSNGTSRWWNKANTVSRSQRNNDNSCCFFDKHFYCYISLPIFNFFCLEHQFYPRRQWNIVGDTANLRTLPFVQNEDTLSTWKQWEEWIEGIERECRYFRITEPVDKNYFWKVNRTEMWHKSKKCSRLLL
jgi:hypothetical protein